MRPIVVFLIILAIVFGAGFFVRSCSTAAAGLNPETINPGTGEYLRMVQPNGINVERDTAYASEVNMPNSKANVNNAEARKLDAESQAILLEAQPDVVVEQRLTPMKDVIFGILGGLVLLGILIFVFTR